MSTDTAPPLKLDNITESLALVHGTLGYIPEQSLVIVGLAGSTSAAHLRIDLRPMMSAERDTTHQLVSWLVEDPTIPPRRSRSSRSTRSAPIRRSRCVP